MATKTIFIEDLNVGGVEYSFDLVVEYDFDYCEESDYAPGTCELEIQSYDIASIVTYFDEDANDYIQVTDIDTLELIFESVDVYSRLIKEL